MKCLHCLSKDMKMSKEFEDPSGKVYVYAACKDCGFVMRSRIKRGEMTNLMAAPEDAETVIHAFQMFSRAETVPSRAEDHDRKNIDLEAIRDIPEVELSGPIDPPTLFEKVLTFVKRR